jgi:hypothetical protein|mmetsp:Transcript_3733/g.7132  ORF Transcript_3733/g.7132 Transcript_3733/m.7132 type:complete len:231 (+) Transcript_3733:772-1464(+)
MRAGCAPRKHFLPVHGQSLVLVARLPGQVFYQWDGSSVRETLKLHVHAEVERKNSQIIAYNGLIHSPPCSMLQPNAGNNEGCVAYKRGEGLCRSNLRQPCGPASALWSTFWLAVAISDPSVALPHNRENHQAGCAEPSKLLVDAELQEGGRFPSFRVTGSVKDEVLSIPNKLRKRCLLFPLFFVKNAVTEQSRVGVFPGARFGVVVSHPEHIGIPMWCCRFERVVDAVHD